MTGRSLISSVPAGDPAAERALAGQRHRGLDSIVDGSKGDREVGEAAIFALSQRPKDGGVPVLIGPWGSSRSC